MLVNCRIGSLEMSEENRALKEKVNCRIGSLEMYIKAVANGFDVNCRIGSLEKKLIDEILLTFC